MQTIFSIDLFNIKRGTPLYIITCCVVGLLLFIASSQDQAFATEAGDWDGVSSELDTAISNAVLEYESGDAKSAATMVTSAYFDIFEESGMEVAVSVYISDGAKSDLEGMFGALRGAIKSGAPVGEVSAKAATLTAALKEASIKLPASENSSGDSSSNSSGGGSSALALFINSLIIILREGLEAILVIAAISTYLVKSGSGDRVRTVYYGAVAAIALSIATAVLLEYVIDASGASREALEGIVMLLATAVLFYVSYWLISKAEAAKWMKYIKGKVEGAARNGSVGKGNMTALFFAAFLAVYREGAETILFYQALYSGSGESAVYVTAGLLIGSVLLAVVFFLVRYGAMKVPMGPFFAVTSAFMYYLAFTFAGKGVRELQEAGWIGSNYIEWVPSFDLIGLYPTVEGVVLQSLLIVALIVATVYLFLMGGGKPRAETH